MELLLLVGDLELENHSYLGPTGQPHTKVGLGTSDTGTRIETAMRVFYALLGPFARTDLLTDTV